MYMCGDLPDADAVLASLWLSLIDFLVNFLNIFDIFCVGVDIRHHAPYSHCHAGVCLSILHDLESTMIKMTSL